MRKKAILGLLLSVSLLTPAISLEPSFLVAEQSIEVDCNNLANARMIKNEELEKVQTLAVSQEVEVAQQEVEIVEEQEDVEATNEEVLDNREYWTFEISYYCGCWNCTQNGDLTTASGTIAEQGRTVATPSDIPFGSEIYVDGIGTLIAEDRGGYIEYTYDDYGNIVMRLDVYLDSHELCYEYGRHYSNGYIIRNENY